MQEKTASPEETRGIEVSSEELRWRMEKVVQISSACHLPAAEAAIELNSALHLLAQGTRVKPEG